MKNLLTCAFAIVLTFLFIKAFIHAIDTHINNQDAMLCNSALKSRNAEYLKKCECFYKGSPISCIQKGGL